MEKNKNALTEIANSLFSNNDADLDKLSEKVKEVTEWKKEI